MSNQMQPQPVGADRPGYGWRQERRQAKNAGMYDPNAQPQGRQGAQGGWGNMGGQFAGAQAQGDQNYWTPERMRNAKPMPMPTMPGGGMLDSYSGMNGGFNPWGGMQGGGMNDFIRSSMMYGANAPMYANQGGYNPNANQGGAAPQGKMPTSVPPQKPQQGPQGAPQSYYEGSQFNTQFGNLVPASVGNGNIYKQNGSDGQTLYHYGPTAGWKSMTNQEYQGYNNPADFYQDPNQYAAQAGGNRNDYQMRNGMWQTQLGSGTYR